MSTINDPAKFRKRDREQQKNRRKRKREEVEEEKIVEKKNRKTQVDELIASGYTDARKHGKTCPTCDKMYIKSDGLTTVNMLQDNETLCGYSVRHKRKCIQWSSHCISCHNKIRNKSYFEGTREFDNKQIHILKRHLPMNTKDRRKVVHQLREESKGNCAICGIQTIRAGKSGFRKESFTDMYPKRRTHDDPSCGVADLRLVCNACQNFQNDLNWNEVFDALCTIREVNQAYKNLSPLNDDEWSYFIYSACHNNGKTPSIKRELFDRDGRHCQYTGIEMKFEAHHWNTVSFDRFDSKQLYTLENTHLVCKNINYVKRDSITEEELFAWLKHIRGPNFVFQHDQRMKTE